MSETQECNVSQYYILCMIFLGLLVGCMPCYNLTFWRPQAPPSYAILGDCVTSRFVKLYLDFAIYLVFVTTASGLSIKFIYFVYMSYNL